MMINQIPRGIGTARTVHLDRASDEQATENDIRVADIGDVDDDAADEPAAPVRFSISSYAADYTVDSLVSRLERGSFFVPPFQRAYVWNQLQASQFIESLLLGLPVPSVFVARDMSSSKHLVIDGRQRLKTLQYFFNGNFREQEFRLKGVDSSWEDRTLLELDIDDRQRLANAVMHVTVFKQAHPDDDQSIYSVFERLNTGGSKLYPQEIRNCVSHGRFIDLLNELNAKKAWRRVFGPESKRQKDQELILRFLAFYYNRENYQRPMRDFLDQFTRKHRNLDVSIAADFRKLFVRTITLADLALGNRPFRIQNLNAAIFDSVMVGLAHRISQDEIIDHEGIKRAYDKLLSNERFMAGCLYSTADVESVRARFQCAEAAFRDLK